MSHRISLTLWAALTVFLAVTSLAANPPRMNSDFETLGCVIVQFSQQIADLKVEHRDGVALIGYADLDALARQFNVYEIQRCVPFAKKPDRPEIPDITRFYRVLFPEEINLHQVAAEYVKNVQIITAEPEYTRQTDYIPNDPLWYNQWAPQRVGAPTAYNFSRGSHDVVVGIIDTGTDTAHYDLRESLWINYGEDVNGDSIIDWQDWDGLDNDLNTHADDFWGWSFYPYGSPGSYNINDPPTSGHGSHCAGDAAAPTDNGIGVASLGAKARIMTIKAGEGLSIYPGWIEGIYYCADMGADVISLSFGGGGYSALEQNAISYAWTQGVTIFAAAGNEYSSNIHYPAGYTNVISVAATTNSDHKADFSNFGTWIDICAPGVDMVSTVPPNTYAAYSGTSMASPFAAGLACLILAAKPNWTNQQVQDHIFSTCVNIDALNPGYEGLLGHGRIDAGTALSILFPNFVFSNLVIDDVGGNNNGRPDPGETANLTYTLQNTSVTIEAVGVTVWLTCDDADITLLNSENHYTSIPTGGTVNNLSDPFSFTVASTAQPHEVLFVLFAADSATGLVQSDSAWQMIGRPTSVLIDDDGGHDYQQWYFRDFDSLGIVVDYWDINTQGEIPESEMDYYRTAIWFTSNEDDPLNGTEQSSIQYFLTNGNRLILTGEDIDEQLAGTSFYTNVLRSESLNNVGAPQVLGIPGNPISDGQILYLAGFGGAGNYQTPSAVGPAAGATQIYNYSNTYGAGISWDGGDARLVYLPFCFEGIGGASNTKGWEALASILEWFDAPSAVQSGATPAIPINYSLGQNYPNPFNPKTEITFGLPKSGRVKLAIYNLSGRLVTTLLNGPVAAGYQKVSFDASNLGSGIYLYRIESGAYSDAKKMVLLK